MYVGEKRVLDYVYGTNIINKILDDISKDLGYSKGYLIRCFKELFGMSFKKLQKSL